MNIEPLIYWIAERDSIRNKKLAGLPSPWTEDPILQTFRFCNVRRREDRVSVWLCNNVLTEAQFVRVGAHSFLQFSAFCRWCNWPPTIKAVIDAGLYQNGIDWGSVLEVMDSRHLNKEKLWTGAYMIKSAREWQGKKKHFGIINEIIVHGLGPHIGLLLALMEMKAPSKFEVWRELTTLKFWGGFMAGQVVDDWTWTPLLAKATDIYTWAPQGPGSIRGFNRLMEYPLRTRHAPSVWNHQLQQWRKEVISRLGPQYEDITLMDLQNCLCEADKYLRVKNGEGRPRSKYRPETAY